MNYKILIRYLYRRFPFDDIVPCETEFLTFVEFDTYLRWEPEKSAMIGAITLPEDQIKRSRSSGVRVLIKFEDGTEKNFKDYQELSEWVKANPQDLRKRIR